MHNSAFTVNSNTAISLSVGKGGRGSAVSNSQASDGDNTTFGSLTATGGGGGNGWGQTNSGNAGRSGGSVVAVDLAVLELLVKVLLEDLIILLPLLTILRVEEAVLWCRTRRISNLW